MLDFIKKNMIHLIVGIGLLSALIFYSLNLPQSRSANLLEQGVNSTVAPLQKQASRTGGFFSRLWYDYIALTGVRQENIRLREEIKSFNTTMVSVGEAMQANQRLAKLLSLRNSIKEPTVAAEVIGEDVTPWFRTLTIDRGSSSGIKEGMPVLAAAGIVGQTIKVSANSSRVLLITDHSSGVAALIQSSRGRGVIKGKGNDLCSLEYVKREEDVKVGDLIVTSGIGGVFAKGLPIGEVTMVKKGEYGIFQTVTVRPAVSSAKLEEVLVVLRSPAE